jgi:hypothetical protein
MGILHGEVPDGPAVGNLDILPSESIPLGQSQPEAIRTLLLLRLGSRLASVSGLAIYFLACPRGCLWSRPCDPLRPRCLPLTPEMEGSTLLGGCPTARCGSAVLFFSPACILHECYNDRGNDEAELNNLLDVMCRFKK